jgi:hypothetical protein
MAGINEDQERIIEKLRSRVVLLEQLLAVNNILIPPDADAIMAAGPAHLSFPELDFSEPKRKPPRKLEVKAALEEYSHVIAAMTSLWGHDGFEEYLAKLIVDERGNRKGFSMEAMEEMLVLARVARQRKAFFGVGGDGNSAALWGEAQAISRRAASAT